MGATLDGDVGVLKRRATNSSSPSQRRAVIGSISRQEKYQAGSNTAASPSRDAGAKPDEQKTKKPHPSNQHEKKIFDSSSSSVIFSCSYLHSSPRSLRQAKPTPTSFAIVVRRNQQTTPAINIERAFRFAYIRNAVTKHPHNATKNAAVYTMLPFTLPTESTPCTPPREGKVKVKIPEGETVRDFKKAPGRGKQMPSFQPGVVVGILELRLRNAETAHTRGVRRPRSMP